jgi:hypothetical protein
MFGSINGLPLHPLVVHAIVVLLPLAALGTIAICVVPRWRVTHGPLVVAAALAATVLIPVATSSGEALEEKVGDPERHAQLGEQLIWFALPLLLLVTALVWLERRRVRLARTPTTTPTRRARTWTNAVAVLSIVAALAMTYQVIRVGDSGAKAAWGDNTAQTQR